MEIQPKLNAENVRVLIVVSKFNEFITGKLKDGAVDCILQLGGKISDIDIVWVPGSYEIPHVIGRASGESKYDAIIGLGCVIRGATSHFEHIANAVSGAIMNLSLTSKVPIGFGVLTTDTIEQAIERAGTKHGNKGWESARSVLETLDVMRKLEL